MLKLNRVCVPLTLDCNLHCKYCYRDKEKLGRIPDFTDDMKVFLGSLKPSFCEAVVASGGETLLHFDKVKELFSYVPKNVHKKIMTNCTLITKDIVDYLNKNEIELQLSHDGPKTEFLRGVDVLKNKDTCDLIRQVNIIRCYAVLTKYNTDCWENYFDTITKLGRFDIQYDTQPMYDVPSQKDLIDGFDYEQWWSTYVQMRTCPLRYRLPWYNGLTLDKYTEPGTKPGCFFDVLPDGTVCGMINICSVYGNVFSKDKDELRQNLVHTGRIDDLCNCLLCNNKCDFIKSRDLSSYSGAISPHVYRWKTILKERWNMKSVSEAYDYVIGHWKEIKEKYGYKG